MNDLSSKIAESLLQIKAIKLNPANHFTWASGWYSPIYCDNRKILSYPAVRKQVYEGFERIIAEKYPDADIIAGVATGAIAHGTLLDPLARLQLALGQIPPPVAENHQHTSPGIRDQTAARFDQGHRRAEPVENGLYFFGYYG